MTTPTTVSVRLQLRADTAANWTSANPTLLANELGRETDTGKIKIGDGSTAWSSLAYQAWATLPIAVASGGTGQTSYTNGQLLIGNTTGNTLTKATLTAGSGIAITNGTGSITVAASGISDAQIAADAEIAVSKLADGAARQLLQTDAAGTGVEWASNIDIPGTLDVTSAATFDSTIGASAGTASLPSITFTGDLNTGIYSPGADQVAISTNGTGRLFVNASGNISNVRSTATAFSGTDAATWANGLTLINTATPGTGVSSFIAFQGTSNVNSVFGITQAGSTYGDFVWAGFNGSFSERMRLTAGGLLGIGTSAPGTKLEVFNTGTYGTAFQPSIYITNASSGGTVSANTGLGAITWATDSNATLVSSIEAIRENPGAGASSALAFRTGSSGGGTERVRITSAGNVGIGTTSPQGLCDVAGSNGRLVLANGNTSGGMKITAANAAYNANGYLAFEGYSSEYGRFDSSGRLLVGTSSTSSSSTAIFQGNSASSTADGIIRLARGTTSPANGDVLGTIIFTDSGHGDAAYFYAQRDGGTWNTSTSRPSRLVFSTTADGASSPTERMRIGNDGRTSAFSASSTNTLTLSSAAAAGTTFKFIEGAYGATGVNTGTESFRVYTNGDVQNTNNSYGSISDIKLKENIVDANSQWDDIKALQVRNYNFKEGQTHTQIGLIAQEVELVSPGLVTESPDRDAEGNDVGTVTKSVNYSVLYMKAVKALQEAMERIETLEQRLDHAGIN